MTETREPTAEERAVGERFVEFMQAMATCQEAGGDAQAAMLAAIPPELKLQMASEMPFLAAFIL